VRGEECWHGDGETQNLLCPNIRSLSLGESRLQWFDGVPKELGDLPDEPWRAVDLDAVVGDSCPAAANPFSANLILVVQVSCVGLNLPNFECSNSPW